MSLQFKFVEKTDDARRRAVVDALAAAGFRAGPLFPDQKRASLAAIYTISEAGAADLPAVRAALAPFKDVIEYAESPPDRRPLSKRD
jgi:hypothetical protein